MLTPPNYNKSIVKKGSPTSGMPQPDWNVTDNGRGVLTGTMKFFYDYSTGKAIDGTMAPARGDKHPYNELLICHDVQTSFGPNDVAYCSANYVGLLSDPSGIEWVLSCPTEEDPIQCHAGFLTPTGEEGSFKIVEKKAEAPSFKPKWVSKNVVKSNKQDFEKFAASPEMLEADLVGVTSYKVPRATIKITLHTANQKMLFEAIKNVGRTYAKPPYAPDWCAAEGRNWLFTSLSVSEYAAIYKLETEYMLSGVDAKGAGKKWNKLIYKEAGV